MKVGKKNKIWIIFSRMFSKLFLLFFKDFIYLFLERGRVGEREGEKHQCVVASHVAPTGDLARNPGMWPDWESNQWPFGSQPVLSPLSYTSQGSKLLLIKYLASTASENSLENNTKMFTNIAPYKSLRLLREGTSFVHPLPYMTALRHRWPNPWSLGSCEQDLLPYWKEQWSWRTLGSESQSR